MNQQLFENFLGEVKERHFINRKSPVMNEADLKELGVAFCKIGDVICGRKYDFMQTKNDIKRLVYWTYNQAIENDNNLKGFLIRGLTGRGKTLLIEILQEFFKLSTHSYSIGCKEYPFVLTIIGARVLALEYANNHSCDIIEKYSTMPILCVDDIGSEPDKSSSFGNKCSVVSEILCNRADRKLITFATTNVSKLSEVYDDRVCSRLN